MTERYFNDVSVVLEGGDARFKIDGYGYDEDQLERLADDIRAAQCWVRDQKRRQQEDETPELPL